MLDRSTNRRIIKMVEAESWSDNMHKTNGVGSVPCSINRPMGKVTDALDS